MKSRTDYLWFNTAKHREYVRITDAVAESVAKSGVKEGMVLVSAMHITAGVFVNDDEPGILEDIDEWAERLAPYREDYRHHRTGETTATPLEEPARPSPGRPADHRREAGPRPVAAALLCRIRRPAAQARRHQGDGRMSRDAWRRVARQFTSVTSPDRPRNAFANVHKYFSYNVDLSIF